MKTKHILFGLRPEPLASYLAGLGLIRVLGEQGDPEATFAWAPDGLTVTTTVEDLASWLASGYRPTPVLSPWNNGSGYGLKDKEPVVRLNALREHPSPRFDSFRAADTIAERVIREARDEGWEGDKKRVVREFRNWCPDELLPWIDATVVLTGADTVFPPLLGTGGNDGRLDFSTNFHRCLLDVIGTARSAAIARDLLDGTESEQLTGASLGQFDPGSAGGPGSSRFGAAGSLANPWGYALLIEGALLFASSAVRRDQFAAGRTAMPFTVASSPDGSDSGAPGEESHGEVWTPQWEADMTLPEVKQLFADARASWRGSPARRASDFYAATRTLGVARGVTAFTRYGMHRRNGLSFAAVPLDHVDVREQAEVRLAAKVEDWANRFSGADASAAVGTAARAFQQAHLTYVRDGGAQRLVVMLAALTTLEQAVGRSGRARENVHPRYVPPAGEFLAALAGGLDCAELRVAVGLASCQAGLRSMRQLLLPIDPGSKAVSNGQWRDAPVIAGFGARPLANVLADVLIWRSRTAVAEPSQFRGIMAFRAGVRVPAADLHAFARGVRGEWDDTKFGLLFRACLALNWRNADHEWTSPRVWVPVPSLGVLQPLAEGIRPGADRIRAGASRDEPELALDPSWAARLVAGHVPAVHEEAARRLCRVGWEAVPVPPATVRPAVADGIRIAAALVPRCHKPHSVLPVIATKIKVSEEES
jgi:CRISPR-associated protein Csx17